MLADAGVLFECDNYLRCRAIRINSAIMFWLRGVILKWFLKKLLNVSRVASCSSWISILQSTRNAQNISYVLDFQVCPLCHPTIYIGTTEDEVHDNWLEEKCVRVCRHDPTIKWERLEEEEEEEEEHQNSFILVINDRIKATVTDYEYLLTYDGIRNMLWKWLHYSVKQPILGALSRSYILTAIYCELMINCPSSTMTSTSTVASCKAILSALVARHLLRQVVSMLGTMGPKSLTCSGTRPAGMLHFKSSFQCSRKYF